MYSLLGMNKSEIARILHVHKSTITREFQRNSDVRNKGTYYFASRAERKQKKRYASRRVPRKFTDEMKEMTSPFNKAFEINEDINSGYYIGLDTSIKDSDINNIFLPSIYLKETNENVKLCCYKHYNMLFFIFLNETIIY